MSTATEDSRINELFTQGNHHRNLSVMAINQNQGSVFRRVVKFNTLSKLTTCLPLVKFLAYAVG